VNKDSLTKYLNPMHGARHWFLVRTNTVKCNKYTGLSYEFNAAVYQLSHKPASNMDLVEPLILYINFLIHSKVYIILQFDSTPMCWHT